MKEYFNLINNKFIIYNCLRNNYATISFNYIRNEKLYIHHSNGTMIIQNKIFIDRIIKYIIGKTNELVILPNEFQNIIYYERITFVIVCNWINKSGITNYWNNFVKIYIVLRDAKLWKKLPKEIKKEIYKFI